MNTVTEADMAVLCRPGDVIAVEYLYPDVVAAAIRWGEEDPASHALCCLGGLDIVEASITGVIESNLRNYLRGNCRLTIRSADPQPDGDQARLITKFWLDRVNDPYDIKMIFGMIPILAAKHVISYFSESASDWAVKRMPNFLASSNLSTCAELAVLGIRQFNAYVLPGYDSNIITPGVLRTDGSLKTKTVLEAAVLID